LTAFIEWTLKHAKKGYLSTTTSTTKTITKTITITIEDAKTVKSSKSVK